MKKLFALLLSLTFTAGSAGAAAPQFEQVEESNNLSQLLRSNAPYFWQYAAKKSNLGSLAGFLQGEGVISGDPHIGNFSVVPARALNGTTSLQYLNIDFDDGGTGPFALEFAAFVAIAKASSKDITVKDLTASYIAGLQGRRVPVPAAITRALAVPLADYEKSRQAYVAKKIQGNVFKYKAGDLEAWTGSPGKSEVEALFPGVQVLDVARRPVERGGSMDGLRLWVLAADAGHGLHIFELKQYVDTGLKFYETQASPQNRIQSLYRLYWPGLDPKAYGLVSLQGTFFWLREKKVELMDYAQKTEEDEVRIYVANQIGFFQRGQPQASGYVAKVLGRSDDFRDAVKDFVKTYLDVAKDTLKQR
jgi:hypothetical protein